MFNEDMTIQSFDPELSKAIEDEIKRQENSPNHEEYEDGKSKKKESVD